MNEPYRVLYIDDDKMLLDLGKLYLERQDDFQVAVTTSAQEVLSSLHSGRYDAIISDFEMPGMTGIELLKAVRNQYPTFPFILFTGRGREDVVIDALNYGADFYLQKGGDPRSQFAELAHKVRQAVLLRRTEHALKTSVQELSQASTRYAALIAASHTGAWEYHADTGYLWCSPEYFSMLGRDISEYNLTGSRNVEETWHHLLHPDDLMLVSQKFEAYLKQPVDMYEQYFRMLHADGNYVWIWSRGRTILNHDGTPTSITVGTHIDITERKQQEADLQRKHEELQAAYDVIARTGEDLRANLEKVTTQEQALQESEEKFRTFFESAGDAIIILDNGLIYDCNCQTEILFRLSKARLIGKSPTDFAPFLQPDGIPSRDLADDMVRAAEKGDPISFEFVHCYPDGTEFFTEVTFQQIRMHGRMFQQAIIRDITERKKNELELIRKNEELHVAYEEILSAEEESRKNQQILIRKEVDLQKTKTQLDNIISFLPDATFVINRDGIVIAWNRTMEELTGIPADQIIGQGEYAYAVPFYHENRPMLIDLALSWDTAFADRYPSITRSGDYLTSEISLPHFKGGIGGFFWFTACPFYDQEGNVTGAIECIRDITDRKNTELALAKHLVALTRPLEDISISFEDLFEINEIQHLQDEFADACGVASIITHPDGTPVTKPSNFTRLCSEIIRKTEKGCENCYRSDAIIGSPHLDGPVVQPCSSGGLWDAGAGIVIGNRHVANWLIGQVRGETHTEDAMREYARKIGADEEAALAAFREVPSMPVDQFRAIAQYLFTIANQLSRSAYQNIQQARFIMDRRLAENALIESEKRLDQAMAIKNEGYWDWDLVTNVTFFDDRYYSMAGYEPNEFPRNFAAWAEHVHPDDISDASAAIHAYLSGASERFEIEFRFKHKGGYWIWIQGRGRIIERDIHGSPLRMIGTHTDITDRKMAEIELARKNEDLHAALEEISATEEELRHQYEELTLTQEQLQRNQQQLEDITRAVPGVVYQFYANPDVDMGLYYISSRALDVFGISTRVDDFFERFTKHVDNCDRDEFLQSITLATRAGKPWHYEGRFNKPSGEQIWFQGMSHPVRHGVEIVFNGILLDITDRKVAEIELSRKNEELAVAFEEISSTEEELRSNLENMARQEQILNESKAFLFRQNLLFSTLLDNLKVGVFMVAAPGGTPLIANSAAREMLGRGILPDATGENLSEVYKAYKKGSKEPYPVAEMPIVMGMYGEHAHIDDMIVERPDGSEILLEVSGTPIQDENGTITASLVTFSDITRRKQMEEVLVESTKKLRLLTRLTRHDIINALTAMHLFLGEALESTDMELIRSYLSRTLEEGNRIKQIVKFTRDYENLWLSSGEFLQVGSVIESAQNEVSTGSIAVQINISPDFEIFADPIIRKVFSTIIENAVRHGKTATQIVCSAIQSGDDLVIHIEDDGIGIPPGEKELIFHNGHGKNTGIGLFLAREILAITGLSIRETGEPGKGARFEITIPDGKWRKKLCLNS